MQRQQMPWYRVGVRGAAENLWAPGSTRKFRMASLHQRPKQPSSPLGHFRGGLDQHKQLRTSPEATFKPFRSLPRQPLKTVPRKRSIPRSNLQAFWVTSGAVGASPDIPDVLSAFGERCGRQACRAVIALGLSVAQNP